MSGETNEIIVPRALAQTIESAMGQSKFVYITAQTGWGKTTALRKLLERKSYGWFSLRDDPDALAGAENSSSELIVLDDLYLLAEKPEEQGRLCRMMQSAAPTQHMLLLSRAPLPSWLAPFQITGLLCVVDETAFVMDANAIGCLAKTMGFSLPIEDIQRIRAETIGSPVAVRLILLLLKEGRSLSKEMIQYGSERLFAYFDERVYLTWDRKTRRLMLSVSLFDSFTLGLARAVTGDNETANTLRSLLQTSSFLEQTGDKYTIRFDWFRKYLRIKTQETYPKQEINAIYASAGLYYQLHDDIPGALACYANSENHSKVSELLIEHSKLHPGIGAYYETRQYYRSLPQEEIHSSPELMCGMSMLSSLCFDVEGSEYWYGELKAFAQRTDRQKADYRAIRGWVAYLDIALPHRGCANIAEVLLAQFKLMAAGEIALPEFSVTSNLPSILRGGKDFSTWVPRDKLMYTTISKPLEVLLGRLGVGLPDVALAESRYEKGEDITDMFLTLASRQLDVQQRGAPEIEFVLVSIMALAACRQGSAAQAVQSVTAFRKRMEDEKNTQLLPNTDALLCRLSLLGDAAAAHIWFSEQSPDETDFFIMERYRYFTKVRCYILRQEYLPALALLGRIADYVTRYDRALDHIEALILLAICRRRMGGEDWQEHLAQAVELAKKYGYVMVFAREGVALAPLLNDLSWNGDKKYLARLRKITQQQASLYPHYLEAPSAPIERLTESEEAVLRLMCRNKSNQEICEILNISINTLKTRIRHLFAKLGAKNRNEARQIAQRMELE